MKVNAGAAYVLDRWQTGFWQLAFGWSVAISGTTVVIGAPKFGGDAGAVYQTKLP